MFGINVQFTDVTQTSVMFLLLLTMFNLLLQKTKKLLIEGKSSEDGRVDSNVHVKRIVVHDMNDVELKETVYDIIKTIKDPEKPATLEDLNVIQEEDIHVSENEPSSIRIVRVVFTPTVPHCNLATLIGLCIRVKLQRMLTEHVKVDIYVKEGSHSTELEVNKQVNDKERVAAAMENPNLLKIVETCIQENDL